jgi:glycosyltransferase involved in cell wall biosynthesis
MKPHVLIVCNALDDATRLQRGISTDSPAASRKVFMLCQALRRAGVRPYVLSLGRGRAGGSLAYFPRQVRRVNGIPVVYAPFSKVRWLSELISLLAPLGIAIRLSGRFPKAMIFYNREIAYAPTLLVATLLRYRRVLDLEDGEVGCDGHGLSSWVSRNVCRLYDRLCSSGALLACSALSATTAARPVLCYYGTAESSTPTSRWAADPVRAVLGGTLSPDTGVDTLIEAVRILRRTQPAWAKQLHVEITGKGPSLDALMSLAAGAVSPLLTVHGRTTDDEYRSIVARCEMGLALKPRNGPLAHTTFPSKVVELASAAMLVLTTDISDVRAVLGEGALYLERDDPNELIELLRRVVEHRVEARAIAEEGCRTVWARCAPDAAGKAVSDFIFGTHR